MTTKAVKRYLVETPNKEFEGRVCGVRFHAGRAIVDKTTIDPKVNSDVEEVAQEMKARFGLSIRRLNEQEYETLLDDGPEEAAQPEEAVPTETAKSAKIGKRAVKEAA